MTQVETLKESRAVVKGLIARLEESLGVTPAITITLNLLKASQEIEDELRFRRER